MDAQDLSRWAIRISVACYVMAVTARLHRRHRTPSTTVVALWATGCAFYLAHMLLAFHAFHDWSHDAAVQFTADETFRLTGIRRGDGVWVNYLFAVVWIADCYRLADCRRRSSATSRVLEIATAVFFALMMFSATVIFGPPFYRILFLPLAFGWGYLWLFRHHFRQEKSTDEQNRSHGVAEREHE